MGKLCNYIVSVGRSMEMAYAFARMDEELGRVQARGKCRTPTGDHLYVLRLNYQFDFCGGLDGGIVLTFRAIDVLLHEIIGI